MEFDPNRDAFVLTPYESRLFRVPDGATEWPLGKCGELAVMVSLTEHDLADICPTTANPADRSRAIADHTAAVRHTMQARQLLAQHAIIGDDDLARLLG